MSNESGRWTAGEIHDWVKNDECSYLVIEYQSRRDKVFYSADKAVLKEDIEDLFENYRGDYFKIDIKKWNKLKERISKSEEASNVK
jgi:hypothetical protein